MDATEENNKSALPLAIPGAIIVAGLIIAGAVYYGGDKTGNTGNQVAGVKAVEQATEPSAQNLLLENLRPIGPDDHIIGSPNAPIKIIEYSDLECPFCKNFHQTMLELVQTFPREVAWVFRHFPLDQLHSKARAEAEATECAYELGGPDKFWEFTNRVFEITPSNNGLDPTQLPAIAKEIGLDQTNFNACLTSGRMAARIESDYRNATDIGARGTPFPVIITPDDKKFALEGAVPLDGMKQLVGAILSQNAQ